MTGQIRHVHTNAVPDGTATSVVRPSDWNSAHAFTLQDGVSLGGNTAGVLADITSGTLFLAGGNNITLSQNGNSVTVSGAAAGAADGFNILAAGAQTALTNTTVLFSNSNGISFGMSGSSRITASYTVPSQSVQPGLQSLSAGATRVTTGEVVFSNSNGLAFGANGQTITGSYTVPTVTNSSMSVSDAATSGTLARLAFTNLNGITLSLSTGAGGSHTIVGSYTVPTVTNSAMTVSDAATSGTLARLAFTNLNGVTLSLSTGAGGSHTIVGSHNALTSQSNQNVTAANGGFAFQTLSFSNANGVSFGTSAGSAITASHNALTSQSNQQMTMFATGNTTQSSTGTTNASSLIFNGAGIASVGITGGSVVISVPAAAPINRSWHEIMDGERLTTCALLNNATFSNRILFVPFWLDGQGLSCNTVRLLASRTGGTSLSCTLGIGFYSYVNSTRLSLGASTTQSFSLSTSADFSGVRAIDITGMGTFTLSEGRWYLGILNTVSASAVMGLNLLGGDNVTLAGFLLGGTTTAATHSTSNLLPFWGVYSANTGGFPGTVNRTQISGGDMGANSPDVYAALFQI